MNDWKGEERERVGESVVLARLYNDDDDDALWILKYFTT